jgi:hypothetical protein
MRSSREWMRYRRVVRTSHCLCQSRNMALGSILASSDAVEPEGHEAALNKVYKKYKQSMFLVQGPGHVCKTLATGVYTEPEGNRELAQHGILPRLAGRRMSQQE